MMPRKVTTIAKKKKKSSGALVLIIILVCVGIAVTGIIILAMPSQPSPGAVLAEHAAIDLYDLLEEVLAIDLEEGYPQTPEEVVQLFNSTFRILYGWDRSDVYMISRVLEIQRGLYAQALLELNPFQQQLSMLLFSLDEQYNLGLEIIGIYQGAPVFNRFSPDRCVITVIRYANNGQSFHYDIHLFQHPESGRWEIGMWVEI